MIDRYRYVILAVTAEPTRYCVPSGMAARLWLWAGYTPYVIRFHEKSAPWSDPLPSRVMQELSKWTDKIFDLDLFEAPRFAPADKKKHVRDRRARFDAVTACRRFVAAGNQFQPPDYILIGDADMLMLRPDYCDAEEPEAFTCWGPDFFRHIPGRWPSCYQGTTNQTWREIMRPTGAIAEDTVTHMRNTIGEVSSRGELWCCETGFRCLLAQWPGYPKQCREITRGHMFKKGRMDFRYNIRPPDPVDYHIRQEWASDAAWAFLKQHATRIPPDVWYDLEAYRNDCLNLLKGL